MKLTSTTVKIIYSTVVIGLILLIASMTESPSTMVSSMALVLAVWTRAELFVAGLILKQLEESNDNDDTRGIQ